MTISLPGVQIAQQYCGLCVQNPAAKKQAGCDVTWVLSASAAVMACVSC